MTSVDQAERLRHLARTAGPGLESPRSPRELPAAGGVPNVPPATTDNNQSSPSAPALVQPLNGTGCPTASGATKRRRIPFVVITSGKGGVGKSNIAVNLAIALAGNAPAVANGSGNRRRITLIDADLGTANADVLCGINAPHTLAHLLQGRRQNLADLAVEAPGGFRLVPGASGIRRVAELSETQRAFLIRELTKLEQTSDLVLIDTGAGISDSVTSMTSIADLVVVVLTPEPTSIADGYGLIKSIHREAEPTSTPEQRFAILVNMAASRQQARAVYDRVAAVSRRFLDLQLDFAGYIPQDAAVPRAVLKRTPFLQAHPHCPASRAIHQLAQSISGFTLPPENQIAVNGRDSQSPGYFSRLFHWLR